MADPQRPAGPSNAPRAAGPKPAAKPVAKSAPAGGEDALLANLIDSATAKFGPPCEECGVAMERGAIVCSRCGFNRNTGKAIKTRVMKAEKDKTPKAARSGPRFSLDINPWFVFFGFMVVFGGLYMFAREEPAAVVILYGASAVTFSLGYIYAIYGAFRDGDGGWGLIGIISFFVGFGGFLMLYYVFAESDRSMSKVMLCSGFLGIIMCALALFTLVDTGKLDEDGNARDADNGAVVVPYGQ